MPLPNVVRRVRLYKLLRSGPPNTVEQLARMLHVAPRTIRRDLAVLEQAEQQIEMAEGRRGESLRFGSAALEPRGIRC